MHQSKNLNSIRFTLNIKVILVLLIIFNSVGIRYFQGQGIILGLIILTIFVVKYTGFVFSNKTLKFFILIIFLSPLFIRSFDVATLKRYIVFSVNFLNAFLFVQTYDGNFYKSMRDIKSALNVFFIHAFISVLLIPLPKTDFTAGLNYHTILYIFNYSNTTFNFLKDSRITGFFWEPGILQLFLNLFLFLEIKERKSFVKIGLVIMTILFTLSTAGYLILLINLLYYLIRNKFKIKYILIIGVGSVLLSSIFITNMDNKLSGNARSSSAIRFMNMKMAYNLILAKPLFGYGLQGSSFYANNGIAYNSMLDYFSRQDIQTLGLERLGLTNGILQIGVFFGIPMLLLIFYGILRQKILGKLGKVENLFFFAILFMSALSEPIFTTSFFLIFPISALTRKKNKNSLSLL